MILIVAALTEMWKFQIRKSEHQSSKLGRADRAIIENDNAGRIGVGFIGIDFRIGVLSRFIVGNLTLNIHFLGNNIRTICACAI